MIEIKASGSFKNTDRFLTTMSKGEIYRSVQKYAQQGVAALRAATPADSGLAAASWGYEIQRNRNSITLYWTNVDVESGFPVAIMLQYGYSTGTGGYVRGRDYINPALQPVVDALIEDVWKVVLSA